MIKKTYSNCNVGIWSPAADPDSNIGHGNLSNAKFGTFSISLVMKKI